MVDSPKQICVLGVIWGGHPLIAKLASHGHKSFISEIPSPSVSVFAVSVLLATSNNPYGFALPPVGKL